MPEQSEATETAATETENENESESTEKKTPPPELQAIIDKERQTARDAEKARKALERELNELRQQSMSDQEKAIEAAKAEARTAVLSEVGGKVAAAEVRAAAAGRLMPEQIDTLLDGLNVVRFLTEDGEVDREKVAAFIDGIAPKQDTSRVPNLGQGVRKSSDGKPDVNSLLHRAVRGQ